MFNRKGFFRGEVFLEVVQDHNVQGKGRAKRTRNKKEVFMDLKKKLR